MEVPNSPGNAACIALRSDLVPLGVDNAWLGTTIGMSHFPPFLQIAMLESAGPEGWKAVQEIVGQSIVKHFSHLGEFSRPVVRYVEFDGDWNDEGAGLLW